MTNPNQFPHSIMETAEQSLIGGFLHKLRAEVSSTIEYGKAIGVASSLIAIAGILYWCPRCGQWMGEGSEGTGDAAPQPDTPPPPPRLIKAISTPIQEPPTPTGELPNRHGSKLTQVSGVLETMGEVNDAPAKIRLQPPSIAHGRKVEKYHGGYPRPDSRPHAHDASFTRGDGEEIPLYQRKKDGTVIFDSGTEVVIKKSDNVYEWTDKNTD